jgi:hypothetical protein
VAAAHAAVVETLEMRRLYSASLRLPASQIKLLKSIIVRPVIEPLSSAASNPISTHVKAKTTSLAPKSTKATAGAPSGYAGFTPAQMQAIYGVNGISFGSTAGNGAGETIAIVDAFNDPKALSDLNSFSSAFSLPEMNQTGDPTLTVYNQTGGTSSLPGTDPFGPSSYSWEVEESLDLQWAHAIAPKANIDLVEAASGSLQDLLTACATASTLPGVSIVSGSWASGEYSGESSEDPIFEVPGVTFFFATGDQGAPAAYPASSPAVVAVGGTSLTANAAGTGYGSEAGWSGSGGGISKFEPIPSYQLGKVNGLSATNRCTPDISMDANPNTGVSIYDSYDFSSSPWKEYGGTSLATPMTAALFSIVNQGRAVAGAPSLSYNQTLHDIYSLPTSDFHDVTSGSSTGSPGYSALVGYDLVTGIGTPQANMVVPSLAPAVVMSNPTCQTVNAGTALTLSATASASTSVQWMLETPGATSFSAISGATSSTLNLGSASVSESGNKYEAVFSNYSGYNTTTTVATLTVDPAWLSPSSIATWNSTTQVLTVTGAASIIADPGTDEPIVQASGSAAMITLDPTSGTDIHLGGLSLSNGASAIETSLGAARSITNYHVLVIGTPGSSTAPTYSIDSTSTLNLEDNDMIILYGSGASPLAAVETELTAAYDGGAWDKPGLTSSVAPSYGGITALGYGEASTLGYSTFDGVSLGGNAVLVKYTVVGDTTLSGSSGGSNYSTVLSNYDAAGSWTQGSFFYNGVVDGTDYQAVLDNFDVTLASLLPGG